MALCPECVPVERVVGSFTELVCRDCGTRLAPPVLDEDPEPTLAEVIEQHEAFKAALAED